MGTDSDTTRKQRWSWAGTWALGFALLVTAFAAHGSSQEPAADGPTVQAYTPPSSDFNDSPEDWTAVNSDTPVELPFAPPGPNNDQAVWGPGGLNFIRKVGDPNWTFRAPAKFRGFQLPVYNGVLTYKATTSGDQAKADVFLKSGPLILAHPVGKPDKYGLTTYRLTLNENGGWVDAASGQPPTRDQFKALLANIDDLLLPTWNHTPSPGLRDWANGLGDVAFLLPASGKVRLNHHSMNFGTVQLPSQPHGPHSKTIQLIISNVSHRHGDTLHVHVGVPANPEFQTTHPDDDIDVPPAHFLNERVTFTPVLNGTRTSSLTITTSDPDHGEITVPLTGFALGHAPG